MYLNKWRKGSTHVVLRYAYFSWPRVKPAYIRRKNILFVFYFFILPLLRNISLSGHFWFIGTSWPNLRAHNFLFVWRSNFILVRLTWNGIYLEMQIIQKNKIRQLRLRWTLDIQTPFSITYYWCSRIKRHKTWNGLYLFWTI